MTEKSSFGVLNPKSGDSCPVNAQRATRTAVRTLEQLLRAEYGRPPERKPAHPLDVLIQTILSQNTSDINSSRAFDSLRASLGDWDAVRRAPQRKLEKAIRVGGLASVKSKRIKKILSRIHARFGAMSLGALCGMKPEEAAALLSSFEGVGPKTVNCVLLFGCGMDVFPVDTHILRISKRLGLVSDKATLESAHRFWARVLPEGLAYSLHLNLIEHGRRVCHARNPHCLKCCLSRSCTYFLSRSRRGQPPIP